MINRRCIRNKVFQTIYSFYKSDMNTLSNAEQHLFFNLEKSHQLYFYSLILLSDLAKYAEEKQRDNVRRERYVVEEKLSNTNLIDNQFIDQVRRSSQFQSYVLNNKVSWNSIYEYVTTFNPDFDSKIRKDLVFAAYDSFIKLLYKKLIATPEYKVYSKLENPAYNQDKDFVVFILTHLVFVDEDFYDLLEEYSINWGDDVTQLFNTLLVLVKKSKPLNLIIPNMYKDEQEDKNFARVLLHKSILNKAKYDEMIAKHTKNWDINRIQDSELILLRMAIAEITEVPGIHINISMNEYIDISKNYNDAKTSPKFINGILNSIIQDLKAEGLISRLKQ